MIHIFYDFQEGPWGGGNQFLKALRKIYRDNGFYAENLEDAKVILVNSHHFGTAENLQRLLSFLKENPSVNVIHRIDGPVTLIRGKDEGTDSLIFKFNKLFAAGSIIQSEWCFKRCCEFGLSSDIPHKIIFNAPDPEFFYAPSFKGKYEKVRLIATSWSANLRKGFDVYQWMDRNLDWKKYEMSFVGNNEVHFENIRCIPPVNSKELGELLRAHDIFVTASRNDPCSNSLIEALHCGLPALAKCDGGHPELVGKGGLLFDKEEEIPGSLDKIATDIQYYQRQISLPNLTEVAQTYQDFMSNVHDKGSKACFSQKDVKNFVLLYKMRTSPSMIRRCISRFSWLSRNWNRKNET